MSAGWTPYLLPGERMLWQGRPDDGVYLDRWTRGQGLFGLAFVGFALVWVVLSAQIAGDIPVLGLIFPLSGLPFVVAGLWLAGGAYWGQAYLRRHATYSLSNRRAFIATRVLGRKSLVSLPVTPTTPLRLIPGPVPSVHFLPEQPMGLGLAGFDYLPEAEKVFKLMRQIAHGTLPEDTP